MSKQDCGQKKKKRMSEKEKENKALTLPLRELIKNQRVSMKYEKKAFEDVIYPKQGHGETL